MSEEFEKFKLEYETLTDIVKTCFDAYYKLANMTFAWNASLGAGFGLLLNSNNSNKTLVIGLAAFAAFYNCAALVSYIATVKAFRRTRRKAYALVENREDFPVLKQSLKPKSGIKALIVEGFIASVLVGMIILWAIAIKLNL